MKAAKFAGQPPKPKPNKLIHITKKEYRSMTAGRVADSLDKLFARRKAR